MKISGGGEGGKAPKNPKDLVNTGFGSLNIAVTSDFLSPSDFFQR